MLKVTTYIRDGYTKKDGTCSVNCMFYIDRERIVIPVKVSVAKSEWDSVNERVKGVSKNAKDANLIIQNVKSRINNVFVKYRLENRPLNKKTFLKEYSSAQTYADFWEFMERELKNRKGILADNTYRAQMSTLKKLREAIPDLQISEMNEDAIRDIKKCLKSKYGNSINTITKNLITLKTYVSLAVRKKYIDQNPFDIEKIRRGKGKQVWLTETELKRFYTAYIKKEFADNLHKVLEYFLFSCFTGMRLSDVKNFNIDQVKGDFIIINPIKTKRTSNEMVTIPITKPIKHVLSNVAKFRLKGLVFDCFADQVTNRMLKKIAQFVGVNKDISFHSGRHTFATIFLDKTDDLASLQKLLGHTDIKQTMIYVHLTESKKIEQMNKCWESFGV